MNTLIPTHMSAVLLTGHGGLDMLDYREDILVPKPKDGEVLIRVAAAGINNTDINTRIGWYSKTVTSDTQTGAKGYERLNNDDASWSGIPLHFPRIQGADICGHIVAVGKDVDTARIGQRVLVRSMMTNPSSDAAMSCLTIGSERDGGFAQYVTAPADETFVVSCDWSDAELASIPCAYSTAENLLHRLGAGKERILITGASGGVGSAAVQLAKRRGAYVIAVASKAKHEAVKTLGADETLDRHDELINKLGEKTIDIVIDVVAGPNWPNYLTLLKIGGRYGTVGAIAGPLVELDVRTLYLKDLTLMGSTFQDKVVFENLIGYIERGEIRPVLAKTYPLSDIAIAQQDFLDKKFTGKLVLIPPA